ncbi:hypothetical protein JMUB6875_48220 [Nocardia sp. JMUB6875]|uniref:hypothetical protein n=1 Tax=Nocardia sp. JMUB6875 TaxID=3158170 RepID=UPI0032E7BF8A
MNAVEILRPMAVGLVGHPDSESVTWTVIDALKTAVQPHYEWGGTYLDYPCHRTLETICTAASRGLIRVVVVPTAEQLPEGRRELRTQNVLVRVVVAEELATSLTEDEAVMPDEQ